MKKLFCGNKSIRFLCVLMIFVQLISMSGCSYVDEIIENIIPPIVDNDLVVEALYENTTDNLSATIKVGEQWTYLQDTKCMYLYPGSNILYMVSGSGRFYGLFNEENYFTYVLDYIRGRDYFKNVLVIEKMKPYETADGRDAFISRLEITETDGENELLRNADLLIFPDKRCFFIFEVAHYPEDTVPLDIREVVDTATFDLGTLNAVEGLSFYDEGSNSAVEFTDSENFVTYMDADNRDVYYAYGTYSVYMGEDAIEQVSGMKEYGLTKKEIENGMPSNSFDNFIALVFDIKGYVDEDGNDNENEFTALYIGTYDEENGVMDMLNCSTISFYHWVKEEVE
ncbi:MAG: hypothetical protein J6X94_01380 [Lachnospiraceae bacterium]|nr:hypothetical protein [Lachnospiraceae bacterium]